ncbi:hypothetical protein E2320_011742 [Naja naja]|nr:hypothetical protein E2320_011742 [Naja naja]
MMPDWEEDSHTPVHTDGRQKKVCIDEHHTGEIDIEVEEYFISLKIGKYKNTVYKHRCETHFDEKDHSRECDQWKANYSSHKEMEIRDDVISKDLHNSHNSTQKERGDPQEDTDTGGQMFWPGTAMPDWEEDSHTPVDADGCQKKVCTDVHCMDEIDQEDVEKSAFLQMYKWRDSIYKHRGEEPKVCNGQVKDECGETVSLNLKAK